MIDLTRNAKTTNSVSAQLQPILTNLLMYNLKELKTLFIEILENPDTSVSFKKKTWYLNQIKHNDTLPKLQTFLKNTYLSGADMPVTSKKKI